MFAAVLNPIYRLGHGESLNYTPLIAGLGEIRLLQLTSATSAQLRNVPLDSTPTYHALSYAWGDPTPVAPYSVNGKNILIAYSLKSALARVWAHYSGRAIFLWADAICIDQKNNEEKEGQVRLMSQIYRKASVVVVYLGEDGWLQNSGAAIKAIEACVPWYTQYGYSAKE